MQELLLLLSRFSRVQLCATPWTAAHQAPPSLGFSRQEHWSGLPFPSPMHESEKWKWSRSVVSDSSDPMDYSPPGSSVHGIFWDGGSIPGLGRSPGEGIGYPLHYSWAFLVVVVQRLSRVQLFVISWTAAHQASPSITISWSLLKFMSIESVMPSNHLVLCHPLLLLPSIFPNIRVFSSELALHIRWPKYWSFSFSISPSNEYSGLISFRIDWFYLLAV